MNTDTTAQPHTAENQQKDESQSQTNIENISGEKVALRDIYDINVKNISSSDKPVFSELLESSFDPNYLEPVFTFELFRQWDTHKVLIIHSGPGFDKSDLALYLCYLMLQDHPKLKAFELQQNTDNSELITSIKRFEEPSIMLLHDLHPQHLRYDIPKFIDIISSGNHFAIVTTDTELQQWSLSNHLKSQHWFNVPEIGIYSDRSLGEFLCQKLTQQYESKFEEHPDFKPDFRLKDRLSIQEIAARLKSPVQINLFARHYAIHESSISADGLSSLVKQMATEGEDLVRQWFFTLSHAERVIVLGASLLEGLLDDQFFAALAEVSRNRFWGQSVSELEILDYYHLTFLHPFFRFEKTRAGASLHCRIPDMRTQLIAITWESHRRHMLAALTPLKELVAQSLNRKVKMWELFGTDERRSLFRQAFEKSISDIGLVTIDAVEPILLELAASGNYFIQLIAARAMARWRETGNDDLLFDTLEQWQGNAWVLEQIRVHLAKRENIIIKRGLTQDSLSYVKATAVITLSYASEYDSPNQLAAPIVDYLKGFTSDPDSMVIDRLQKALPRIIAYHALSLDEVLLNNILRYSHFSEAATTGLVSAFEQHPREVSNLLTEWFHASMPEDSKKNRREKLTYRDNVLATILRILMHIDLAQEKGSILDEQTALEWTHLLLRKEKRTGVRLQVIALLTHLHHRNLTHAANQIPELLPLLDETERKFLSMQWRLIHQHERSEQQEAPHEIVVGEDYYPSWTSPGKRPLTTVEEALFKLLSSTDLQIRKFAMLTFLEIAQNFEHDELAAIGALNRSLSAPKSNTYSTSVPTAQSTLADTPPIPKAVISAEPKLSWLTRIILFFAFYKDNELDKQTIRMLLKTLLHQSQYRRVDLDVVVSKWQRNTKGFPTKLGRWLKFFINR